MKQLIDDIRSSLDSFSDKKRVEYAHKSFPTKMHVIGVTVPHLKIVLKELKVQTKSFSTEQKWIVIKLLINENVFELQQLAFEYIQSDKMVRSSITENDIHAMEKNMDNWLSVDYFGTFVVGYAWRENLISTEKVKNYLASDDFWIRRIAVVATISLNQKARGGTGDSKRTLDICRLVVSDHNEMIIKALSWALRELVKVDKKPVIDFIEKHEAKLSKKVLKEVKNKLEFGKKYDS